MPWTMYAVVTMESGSLSNASCNRPDERVQCSLTISTAAVYDVSVRTQAVQGKLLRESRLRACMKVLESFVRDLKSTTPPEHHGYPWCQAYLQILGGQPSW